MSDNDFRTLIIELLKEVKSETHGLKKLIEKESRENADVHRCLSKRIEEIELDGIRQLDLYTQILREIELVEKKDLLDFIWELFRKDWKKVLALAMFFNIQTLWNVIKEIIQMIQ